MRRKPVSLGQILLIAPWWVSASLGVLAFIVLRWVLPAWAGDNIFLKSFSGLFVGLAPFALIVFGALSAASFWFGRRRGAILDEQTSLETIRNMPWKQFELLVAEAYRRDGYQVEYSPNEGADGGVDLVLYKVGRISLVQCKRWKTYSVGAPVIREIFGVMTAEQAHEAIVVTSGRFTRDAQEFAAGKPIRLVDGPQLLALVRSVQSRSEVGPSAAERLAVETAAPIPPACPMCGKPMVIRTARRGKNAGNQFWGCPTYPSCPGTRNLQPQ